MSLEHMQTTEVKSPDHSGIARAVAGLASQLKAEGNDQETIRVALQTFASAAASSSQSGQLPGLSHRPY